MTARVYEYLFFSIFYSRLGRGLILSRRYRPLSKLVPPAMYGRSEKLNYPASISFQDNSNEKMVFTRICRLSNNYNQYVFQKHLMSVSSN